MDSFIYSINSTVPIFLVMILGWVIKQLGIIDDNFASKANKYVFKVALPVLLFRDLSATDFKSQFDAKFVIYCMVVTILMFSIIWILTEIFMKDESMKGAFVQASFRSSAAILGIALIQNIYGTAGMAPLMIIGSVPLYNVMAVLVLSVFQPDNQGLDKNVLKKTFKGIVTNPIIIGIVAGLAWSLLKVPMPAILEKTVNSVGGIATPLGLMAMGASFELDKAFAKIKPALTGAFMKLIGFCVIFLPLAVALGFRQEELVAILVMLGSATTVSCYVMAKNMGHEGVLTSSIVMLTTMFSAFTLTGWLFVLRSMGWI